MKFKLLQWLYCYFFESSDDQFVMQVSTSYVKDDFFKNDFRYFWLYINYQLDALIIIYS